MSTFTHADLAINKQACRDFNETGCVIYSLNLLGLNIAQDDAGKSLEELFEHMEIDTFKEVLGLEGFRVESLDATSLIVLLINTNKYGFFAKCGKDRCTNFRFDAEGRPTGWSSSGAYRWVFTVYAETIPDLIKAIEIKNELLFQKMIVEDKAKGVTV